MDANKPLGSETMHKTMLDFKQGSAMLSRDNPEIWDAYTDFMHLVFHDGVLPVKTKELIALGMAITARCKYCIGLHVRNCHNAGVSRAEIMSVCRIAIVMGGGPAMTYVAQVKKALDEFYPAEE